MCRHQVISGFSFGSARCPMVPAFLRKAYLKSCCVAKSPIWSVLIQGLQAHVMAWPEVAHAPVALMNLLKQFPDDAPAQVVGHAATDVQVDPRDYQEPVRFYQPCNVPQAPRCQLRLHMAKEIVRHDEVVLPQCVLDLRCRGIAHAPLDALPQPRFNCHNIPVCVK